jgi:hypothetical protein
MLGTAVWLETPKLINNLSFIIGRGKKKISFLE